MGGGRVLITASIPRTNAVALILIEQIVLLLGLSACCPVRYILQMLASVKEKRDRLTGQGSV
jgi:hypothetical protein